MVLPYGRARLLRVLLIVALQGAAQAIAVVIIYVFLALVMRPSGTAASTGSRFAELMPVGLSSDSAVGVGVLAVVVLLASAVLKSLATRSLNGYTFDVSCWLQDRLLRTVLNQPFEFHLRRNSTVLAKVIQADVVLVARDLLRPLLDTLATVVVVSIVGTALFILNPAVTTVVVAALLVVYLVVFAIQSNRRRAIGRDMRNYGHAVHREVHETLASVRSIYAYGATDYFAERCARAALGQADSLTRNAVVSEAPRGFAEPILVAVIVGVFGSATARGQDAASLVPIVGTLAVAGFRLIPQIQNAFASASKVDTARPLAVGISELLREGQAHAVPKRAESERFSDVSTPRWRGELELRDVGYSYQPDRPAALAAVDLRVGHGSVVAIVGASGSGKTTVLEVMLGLLMPTCGTVLVDGEPLTNLRVRWWQSQIGYVPQESVMLDDTVLANVAFGLDSSCADRALVWQALSDAQLQDFVRHDLPAGLESRVGERGTALSGGQRQRLGLARALYRKPGLLLLDEATNQLDSANEEALLTSVARLRGRMTIIQVTHRLSPALPVDAVYELEQGRLRRVVRKDG